MLLYFSCIDQCMSSYVVISARIVCFVETFIEVAFSSSCMGLKVQILSGKIIRVLL